MILLRHLLSIALQTAGPSFEPVQPATVSAAASFVNVWADFDGDGDPDLFVGLNGAPNRLYRNDRGRLVDVAAEAGLAEPRAVRAAAWGDHDGDGDPDLLVGFAPGPGGVLRLYRNDAGRFTDGSAALSYRSDSGAVRQPVWLDLDGDEDLDLFVAFRDRPNLLFRNDAGRLHDVAAEVGLGDTRRTVGAVWFDYDQDGDLDLAAANMDGDANGFFRNEGGRFRDVADSAGVTWGGRIPGERSNGTVRTCAADADADGRLDLFFANYGRNGLFLNRGDGTFQDVSDAWGVAIEGRYDTCAFSDFDHDGRLDLYVNGTVTGGVSHPDYLFRNTGTGYQEVTPAALKALHADHGVQWADFDGDGDEDLALTGARPDTMALLWRNLLPAPAGRRSLVVRVVNGQGRATRAGAEVRVFHAGSSRLIGTRLVDAGSGYDAQSELPVHFGLPESLPVDVEVTFPQAGRRVVARVTGVRPNDWGTVLTIRVGKP